MTVCFNHVTYTFHSESRMASLTKWQSICLRTKWWLWVRVLWHCSHLLPIQCDMVLLLWLLVVLFSHLQYSFVDSQYLFVQVLVYSLIVCTRLSACNTHLSIRLSIHSTCLSTCSSVVSACPLVALAWPFCLSTCSTCSAIYRSFYN